MTRVGELQESNVSIQEYGELKEINEKLKQAWDREEAYWHQRARMNWLNQRD